ncbi:MAG: DUF1003 domain-containing protein [Bacteroidota bacterium]
MIIVSFFVFFLLWIGLNVLLISIRTNDPTPFILLNLILSCLTDMVTFFTIFG